MIEVRNTRPGDNGKIFSAVVHKELLCHFSAYYTAALKGGFSEAKKDTITMELPHDQIQDLISWLYSGRILSCTTSRLLDNYIFADEKMMLALRRSIMTQLIHCQDQGLDALHLSEAMPCVKVLPQSSGLFRYLVDFWVHYGSQDYVSEIEEWDDDKRIPRNFFYQALNKFASENNSGYLVKSSPSRECLKVACNYHEHTNCREWDHSKWLNQLRFGILAN